MGISYLLPVGVVQNDAFDHADEEEGNCHTGPQPDKFKPKDEPKKERNGNSQDVVCDQVDVGSQLLTS